MTEKGNWFLCATCRGLFYLTDDWENVTNSVATDSVCVGGSPHKLRLSYNYHLIEGNKDGFDSWGFCYKCKALFVVNPGHSCCPTGGEHERSDATVYSIPYDVVVGNRQILDYQEELNPDFLQDGWRKCNECSGMFYGKQQYYSNCPKFGNKPHVFSPSQKNYTLTYKKIYFTYSGKITNLSVSSNQESFELCLEGSKKFSCYKQPNDLYSSTRNFDTLFAFTLWCATNGVDIVIKSTTFTSDTINYGVIEKIEVSI